MSSRAVLVGYCARGRAVVSALRCEGFVTDLTVVDADPERVEQAEVDGVHGVVGLGWRLNVLWAAGVHTADYVVIAVRDDVMAMRITSVVRSLNETVRLICVVRDPELYELVSCIGADNVLGPVEAAEWGFGTSGHLPEDGGLPELEWVVAERPVARQEIGCSPFECGNQVLAVVRDGRRIWAEDPSVATLRDDDRLLVLSSEDEG
ncbi:NAD(P)-binding protein [Lentzea sp. NPDC034063]|uniref:NAD(P)-binding protein n=1 Tax=unclassified Lentzea TaxID=2643253 RepID=UPI0033C6A5F1